jgi:hypothetical protein
MITLRPEHQQLIEKAMQTGEYEGPDDVIWPGSSAATVGG